MSLNMNGYAPPPEPEDEFNGWLCHCGHWQDDPFHCDNCGNEPPWGCDCCDDIEDWEDEDEDDYIDYDELGYGD